MNKLQPQRKPHRRVKPHHDDEYYDGVILQILPRFKTSELSGDEWRVSCRITFMHKGMGVHVETFGDLRTAIAFLPSLLISSRESSKLPDTRLVRCSQPGCPNAPVAIYRLKMEYSPNGSMNMLPTDELIRVFCSRHLDRGDCGLEDSNANYEVLEGPGPEKAQPQEGDASPSIFGGVIDMTPLSSQ